MPRWTHTRRPRWWLILLLLPWWHWSTLLSAEIYRYQDESGIWHFTDDPPERYESSIVPDIGTSIPRSRDATPEYDLATRLESDFNPTSPVAHATLAVVSIKTDSGEGSGFFCSEEGYILTNRHVVQPDSTEGVPEPGIFQEQEQKLQAIKADLEEARDRLRLMKQDLQGYAGVIEHSRDDEVRSWARNAHERLSQRYRTEHDKIVTMEKSVRTLENDLRRSRQELDVGRRFVAAKKRFEVVLKDGTGLTATLVNVSNEQDLALLKLDGYRTPSLPLDPMGLLSQGVRVFAIGNPLGMQDAVTSGVITQITPEYLLTDAQLLPGSSGGPLVRESGEVIGINVSRKVAAGAPDYAAGFGKVIPIAAALQAFSSELTASNIDVSAAAARPAYPDPMQPGAFGTEGAGNVGGGSDPGLGPRRVEGLGGRQSASSEPAQQGTSGSEAVRLIITDEERGPDRGEPEVREPRSLDFPPEGSGILPPSLSRPPP